jgi:hypothetical protein
MVTVFSLAVLTRKYATNLPFAMSNISSTIAEVSGEADGQDE